MRTALVWEDAALDMAALEAAVTDREIYGRHLTSTCKLYHSEGVTLLTGPESYYSPRNWLGGDVRWMDQGSTDLEAASNCVGYSHLVEHEVTVT
jgi:hypothetical protein